MVARSLLRESQINDVDNMSETEHDEWIHVNLVTSGTVTFTDGNVSGTGDIYAGEYYGDGSNLTGVDHSPTTLYYNDIKAAEASAGGINIFDTSGNQAFMYFKTSVGVTAGNVNFSDGNFSVYDNINTNNIIYSTGGAGVRLYYDGTKTLETAINGASVYDTDGSDPLFYLRNNSGTGLGVFISSSVDFTMRNLNDGGILRLQGEDSEGTTQHFLRGDPDGVLKLYHAGDIVFETTATSGINVVNEVTAVTYHGDGSNLTGIEHPTTTLSGVITNETYETATSTATDTITLDFDHADYGVAYIDGVRQQSDAYAFSGTDQIVFDEAVPSGTEVAFTHLVAGDTETYYTQSQVDAIIATVSGALQAQIDEALAL